MDGLGKLIDWLLDQLHELNPFVIINQYQEGVVLKFGNFQSLWDSKNGLFGTGLHCKIPYINEVWRQHIVPTTLSLSSQSLLTNDGKSIVVKGMIKYRVFDSKKFVLEIYDTGDALSDTTAAIIKNVVMNKTLQECMDNELDNDITKKARVEAKKVGVEIIQVTLTDIAPIRTVRLINDTTNLING